MRSNFLPCFICAFTIVLYLKTHSHVCADEISSPSVKATVQQLHNKFEKIRKGEYGNVHMVMRFVENGDNGYHTEKKIHYWARDGKYFRVDEETITDGEISEANRVIVRPEVYTRSFRTSHGNAVTNVGTGEEGCEIIEVASFFWASTRCYRFVDAECPFGNIGDFEFSNGISTSYAENFTPIEMTRENSELSIKSRLNFGDDDATATTVRVEYDLDEGVLLSYEQTEYSKGADFKLLKVSHEFDFQLMKHIPTKISSKIVTMLDTWQDIEFTVEAIDWSPVPMEIFSIEVEGASSRSRFPRILLIFCGGLVIVGAYFFYRRQYQS